MTKEEEFNAIVDALDTLVSALIADRHSRGGSRGQSERTVRPAHNANRENLWNLKDWSMRAYEGPPPPESPIEELLKRPKEKSYSLGIRVLGERLYALGGMDMMQQALALAALRDPSTDSWRMAILDHRWDGIGSWVA